MSFENCMYMHGTVIKKFLASSYRKFKAVFVSSIYLRSSQHGLKKYIKQIYSTSFLCALLLINIPEA